MELIMVRMVIIIVTMLIGSQMISHFFSSVGLLQGGGRRLMKEIPSGWEW